MRINEEEEGLYYVCSKNKSAAVARRPTQVFVPCGTKKVQWQAKTDITD